MTLWSSLPTTISDDMLNLFFGLFSFIFTSKLWAPRVVLQAHRKVTKLYKGNLGEKLYLHNSMFENALIYINLKFIKSVSFDILKCRMYFSFVIIFIWITLYTVSWKQTQTSFLQYRLKCLETKFISEDKDFKLFQKNIFTDRRDYSRIMYEITPN